MTVTVKNNNKTPLVVPSAVRRQARFKNGQELEFRASVRVITIAPRLPRAEDEYTEEQRHVIDAQLDAAEKGTIHGPFSAPSQMVAHVKGELKKRVAKLRKKKTSRVTKKASNPKIHPDDTLTPAEAKIVRRGEAQLKRGKSKPWRVVKGASSL